MACLVRVIHVSFDVVINLYRRIPALSLEGAQNPTPAGPLLAEITRHSHTSNDLQGNLISQRNESDVSFFLCPRDILNILSQESPCLLVTRWLTLSSHLVRQRKARKLNILITVGYSMLCSDDS